MDPVAQSVSDAGKDLGIPVETVRTFRRYYLSTQYSVLSTQHSAIARVLANDAIEQIIPGLVTPAHLKLGTPYQFKLIEVPLRHLEETALARLSRDNQPSAIEPYGGANPGLGGVIRDPLGTGLGARPICNTDVFCFAPPDTPVEALPPGVLHPLQVMKGVVAGVRDYGNRMGIPTVNGAICFDERYPATPLVFCGTVGVLPVQRSRKEERDGALI